MHALLRIIQTVTDLSLLAAAFTLAYLIRYDFDVPFQVLKQLSFQLPYVVGLEYLLLLWSGAHRVVWRFVAASDVLTLTRPLVITSGILLAARLVVPSFDFPHKIYLVVPFGVIIMNLALGGLAVLGVRFTRRLWIEEQKRLNIEQATRLRRIMLVGAGEAGVLVAKEVKRRPDLGLEVVGFVDDDRSKWGTTIAGYRVLAGLSDLGDLVRKMAVDDVVIAIAGAASATVRRVVTTCEAADVSVKIIPGLYEIIGGQVSVTRLREVEIDDLLGRAAVKLDATSVAKLLKSKVVAVTGAGGSIGSELCRQLAELKPKRILLIERAEHALFEIHAELLKSCPDVEIRPCLADITDKQRLTEILASDSCQVLFHAAAHKHVPMMEWNPSEAIRNNVFGTKCAADVARELGLEHFVLISTDKAVNPTSVMGASKRVAELYIQAIGRAQSSTKFSCVRFGNVLGSAGSVVPIFKKQIANGGPVMVTHPDMVRYFMTIPEAAQLVLQAVPLGSSGDVFILDMGKPVKIVDLAHDLIRLSGLKPHQDIEIKFTGIRPGEKLFEELSTDEEQAEKTTHGKIFIGKVKAVSLEEFQKSLDGMTAALNGSPEEVYAALRSLIPEFSGKVLKAS